MAHYRVRAGFYVHRNGSVLSPGAIIEAEPEDTRGCAHQLEEVAIEAKTTSRTRKPSQKPVEE